MPTPTYASHLNPIECHFTPISQFIFGNADYLDWDVEAWALARPVQRRKGPIATDESPNSNDATQIAP